MQIRTCIKGILYLFILSISLNLYSQHIPKPVIKGDWIRVTGNPDLGEYNTDKQQPVDFGVWQAEDGTWQIWSCIRGSGYPGSPFTTRFLYGWEGLKLNQPDWKPTGIQWTAKSELGETPGGMQAPYVLKENGTYYLFYGDWKRICMATSKDGKHFERYKGSNGEPALFTEHKGDTSNTNNARDAMVIKRGNTYYCYYTSHLGDPVNDGSGYCRSSLDMINWTESVVVSHTAPFHGNSPRYSDECPHVVYLPEHNLYYLFVTQLYGKNSQTTVYASPSPVYFGIDDELRKVCTLPLAAPEIVEYNGKHYIFCLTNELDGIKMAELIWE